ncbi:ATP-binding cassette domain-containing protein [Gryllotalpicola reticulitermitis]|uniref:ATP-binding cassette domain-containing protein n=1 Tax=Gryllotalpicola reticulitermitis TaxID=1184153 RepID=A0ABV8Q851_9MICO
MTAPLLDVSQLTVRTADGTPVVDDISFHIEAGGRLALIGESGSGKSLTSLAVMGLLPGGLAASGSIRIDGVEVIGAPESALNRLRGRKVGIVFQEPLTALDPLAKLGAQLAEPIRRAARAEGTRLSRAKVRTAVVDALAEVAIREPERIARAYPHEVSGGQRQRVAIAMALARGPELLIADEPTTALDVTVQTEVLELLDRVATERGTALLFVSHDLAVVAQLVEQALVLRAGREVERGALRSLIDSAEDSYTRRLVAAARELDEALRSGGRS